MQQSMTDCHCCLLSLKFFIWNGDIPIDALQSVSRLAWVISVASFVGLLHYRLGIVGSFFGGLILIFAQSYAQLTLEVNAQILLNMFFVLSLIWMNLFAMYPRIFSAFLGMTGMLAALSKEQGLLLLPLLFLWVVIQGRRYQKLWGSVILFFLSALPLGIWLYTWLYSMWYRGLKFAELRQDLETLLNAPSWKYAIDQHLNWGKLRVTYDDPQNYWETLLHAWPRLTHDVGNHFILSLWMILLAGGVLIYEKYRREKGLQTDWEGLLAGSVLVLPMVPLFAMLLIEPYHLSFYKFRLHIFGLGVQSFYTKMVKTLQLLDFYTLYSNIGIFTIQLSTFFLCHSWWYRCLCCRKDNEGFTMGITRIW